MENRERELESWVDRRLAGLKLPAEWRPDAAQAYARLAQVDDAMKRRRRQRLLAAALGAAACLAVVLVEAPEAYCAGAGCANQAPARAAVPVPGRPSPQPDAPRTAAHPAPRPDAAAVPSPAMGARNFRETGSASAPVTCEIYWDFECPPCATAFREVIPRLVADYVETGKVRLVYRDLPWPHHPYARLAARYANAAGRLGEYDVVVARIFRTQAAWSATGDIDAQVADVLAPEVMQKVREMVSGDPTLDDSVAADLAMARQEQVRATPSIVVVKHGQREVLSPLPSYGPLKSHLDGLLTPR